MRAPRNLTPIATVIPYFPQRAGIPRVIHQIYFSPSNIVPPVIQANVDRIRALNPGWLHELYDATGMAEFISVNYGPKMLGYYNRINEKYGASRADLFRYLLMYKVGGVYLDIKASLERPLDSTLLDDDVYLLARWQNGKSDQFKGWGIHDGLKQYGGREFQQWHIMAAPGHPFLRAVIERVLQNIDSYNPVLHQTGRSGVLWLTGPIAYTLAIAPLLQQHRYRLVASHDDLGLIYSIFPTANYEAQKTIFKHHYSELTEPVTTLEGYKKLLWFVFGPFQIHVIRRGRRLMEALARRLPI